MARCADDRVGAHHPVFDAGQVHRAAFAVQQAVGAAEQFGEHGCHRHTARERVRSAVLG
jgi:hypothetical protein